jgi:hypothetical protein
MAQIEMVGPEGYTLEAELYPLGSDTRAGSAIALTERTNCKGLFRGTVTGLAGWHVVRVLAGDEAVALWWVNLVNDDGVYYAHDLLPVVQPPGASLPAIEMPVIPALQTLARVRCFDEHGVVEQGVAITIELVSVRRDEASGAYDRTPIPAVSGSDGWASALIPRGTFLGFKANRNGGAPVRFDGVDAEVLDMPAMLGQA